jgi:phage terminase large subunit-like protein
LAAVAIVALLEQLPPASRSYAVAADKDQGRLLLDAIEGFAARTDELRGALQIDRWRISSRSGATLEVVPADAPSAYGLKPHLVIVDELAQWATTPGPRKVWEAIVSAVPKVPNSRLVVLTTAGDQAHWSHKVLKTAQSSEAWRVSEVPGPTPWLDADEIERQRDLLVESSFRRLHLNQWVAGEDRLTTVDDVMSCVTLDGPLGHEHGRRYVIGLDVGLKHDRTVASICHLDGDVVTLDRMQVWSGSRSNPVRLETVEEWLLEAVKQFGRSTKLVVDPWQAVNLIQRLRERRVAVEEFTFSQSSVGRLALTLYRALRDHQLALPDDQDLIDELANVHLVETSPGSYRIDHDPDKHDDRAISLALAANHLLANRKRRPRNSESVARALADLAGPSPFTGM